MRLLKYILYIIMVCIALLAGGAVFIANYVNPNDYKSQISEEVARTTGRKLTINGNISWSFFPWIGVSMRDAQLSNSPGFGEQPFLKIQEVGVEVKILPLLRKKIEIGSIKLTGLELQLTKNSQGVSNWQDLTQRPKQNTDKNIAPTVPANNTTTASKPSFAFIISDITVSNARLVWDDQQKKQHIILRNIEFHTKNTQFNTAFPITLSLAADINKLGATLKAEGTIDIPSQKINLDIKAQLDDSKIIGNISIHDFDANKITLEASLDQMQIDRYMESKEKPAKLVVTNVKISANTKSGVPGINGRLQIGELQAGEIRASTVDAHININDGLIILDPVTAQLYQGKSAGSINVDMRTPVTHLSTRQTLTGIQIQPLLNDLKALTKIKVSGSTNVETQLTASGKDTEALTRSLNGHVKFAVNQGILYGIDIDHTFTTFIDTMDSLVKNIKSSPTDMLTAVVGKLNPALQGGTGQTKFTSFTGTINLAHGIANNNDMHLETGSMKANGAGTANLINQTIDYRLSAIKNDPKTNQPYNYELPILIRGSMAHPKIGIDTAYLNQVIQKEIGRVAKNKLADTITKQATKHLGEEAGKKLGEQLKNLNLDKLFK